MAKNKFVYVNYASNVVTTNLLYWQEKIQDYLIEFYDGNRNNALGTKFGDCANICLDLLELSEDNLTQFREVVNNDMLQAGATIEYRIGEIYLYEGRQQHVLLDIVCAAPWNCLPGSVPETCRGAAEWLIADIIQEITSAPIPAIH